MIEKIITNSAGGKQHKIEGRFDLLPPHALDRIAKILEVGAERYGDWNWTKIPSKDHLNHAINHLFKLISGDTSENHAGNAGCRILFFLDMLYRESASAPGMTDLMVPPESINLDRNGELILPCCTKAGQVIGHKHVGTYNHTKISGAFCCVCEGHCKLLPQFQEDKTEFDGNLEDDDVFLSRPSEAKALKELEDEDTFPVDKNTGAVYAPTGHSKMSENRACNCSHNYNIHSSNSGVCLVMRCNCLLFNDKVYTEITDIKPPDGY